MDKDEIKLIEKIIASDDQLQSIYLKGSTVKEGKSDYWSDIDLLLVSRSQDPFDFFINKLDTIFLPIQAKQLYSYDNQITYRVTTGTEKVIQFDLQIVRRDFFEMNREDLLKDGKLLLGKPEEKKAPNTVYDHKIPRQLYEKDHIDHKWFVFYESVKKVARRDNLIGLHLIFELINEYLILEMKDRDIQENTTIHKYGQNEKLPQEIDLNLLQTDNISDKLRFIRNLAKCYDRKLLDKHNEYISRMALFEKHVDYSIALLTSDKESKICNW